MPNQEADSCSACSFSRSCAECRIGIRLLLHVAGMRLKKDTDRTLAQDRKWWLEFCSGIGLPYLDLLLRRLTVCLSVSVRLGRTGSDGWKCVPLQR